MSKTLTVSEEAYEKLASKKESGESFSDVIKRITGKSNLIELAGVLSNAEAEKIKAIIRKKNLTAIFELPESESVPRCFIICLK